VLEQKRKLITELLTEPPKNLGQIGEIRERLMNAFKLIRPDLVMVFGDVTSTLAGALAAKKAGVQLAHVEAGLRSHDLSMPEEVNRILTDSISDYLFVSEESGLVNLKKEGLDKGNVHLVGNTMIDSQAKFLEVALKKEYYKEHGLNKMSYVVFTLHRPENVDNKEKLISILDEILVLSKKHPVIFPIHHRTLKLIRQIGYLTKLKSSENIVLTKALGYLEFTSLMANAMFIITDSGGLQEESTALNIPCFTLRKNTERPATLIENNGTNQLIQEISSIHLKECKSSIKLWDGKAAGRIKDVLLQI
ncbi:MAG: UDP-N-acetylglucosamine 2-epimerase (non-hydrolyzing), partial [Bacteroidia bacterium]|nr:UDP-N-acetylglucosamine 2-epimerase (non-hydrolyzing) [Bacteroidia bacterium]